MRLFLAIKVPDSVKGAIDKGLRKLKNEYKDLKWVDPKSYHITVHFFGETQDVEKIIPKIEDAIFDFKSLYVYSLESRLLLRRKVYAILEFSRNKQLENIAYTLRSVFNSKTEVKYIPHLTLARYRIPSKQQYLLLKKKFNNIEIDISFKVNKLTLFDCVNYDTVPEYKIIKEFNLID